MPDDPHRAFAHREVLLALATLTATVEAFVVTLPTTALSPPALARLAQQLRGVTDDLETWRQWARKETPDA